MADEFARIDDFTAEPRTAYFSMEIALRAGIPTYAGGLGVLAGDVVRTAADLELPLVAVTLVSREGYFRQEIDPQGWQIEHADTWNPGEHCRPLNAAVAIPIEGRPVWVSGWLFVASGSTGSTPVILLDTDLPMNQPEDRAITSRLYGGDQAYRLKQEAVLGIGGLHMLRALGFTISQYHMNEGHAALLGLALLRAHRYPPGDLRPGESPYDLHRVRRMCNFTTHTPVEAGHDKFPYELVHRILGDIVDLPTLKALAGEQVLNMTLLALNLSDFVNGVARRHAEVSSKLFPGFQVHAITNGVHPFTWTCPSFARLFDTCVPGWAHAPELLIRADTIPDDKIWSAHLEAKDRLIAGVKEATGVALDRERPIIGYARRMTAYKRPELLFSDLARLRAIARRHPFQIVLAGKAHPQDRPGQELIKRLHDHARALRGALPVAFLPNYDLQSAATLVAGVDVWLNTPLPPLEASGTSGMKAALNGVPQLSVLDGWWIEGCIEGVTGWAIGEPSQSPDSHAQALYDKLEQTVLPRFYDDRSGWLRVMKSVIAKNAVSFNSHRMMRRYVTEAYLR
ncbi:MAG TPA: alpha-glucan family phosphorylase [Burkholderiales bacterium]|jgi:starch phosphorylase|nr:alpha-glucan family phosphorylase [Burkholderiales bacterium]